MTITLSEETEHRLLAEAARRGLRIDQLAEQLIDAALPRAASGRANQASIQILDAWEAETATDDPQEIARRQVEFEEFKKQLNDMRLATDGPEARIPLSMKPYIFLDSGPLGLLFQRAGIAPAEMCQT